MMKRIVFLALASFLLFGCTKEGKVDSRQRIQSVYATETLLRDGSVVHNIPRYLSERWYWDNKEVYCITYSDNSTYNELFFYDNRRRIIRTMVPAHGISCTFVYSGRKLARIDCYQNDNWIETLQFNHDGRTLVSIWRIPGPDADKTVPLLRLMPLNVLIGNDFTSVIAARKSPATIPAAKSAPAGQLSEPPAGATVYEFTWSDGNVMSMNCLEPDGTSWQATMTYDSHRNPYREIYGTYELDDPIYGFQMMSKNNLSTLVLPLNNRENQLVNFDYEYQGDYPSSRRTHYSYTALNERDWQEQTCTYQKTEYFTYLD